MPTIKGLTGEWIDVFMCISLHPGTSVLQEYWVMPLVHLHLMTCTVCIFLFVFATWVCFSWVIFQGIVYMGISFNKRKFFSQILNRFEQIWTTFEQVWTHLNPFEHIRTSFEQVWTHLNKFEHIWTSSNTKTVLHKSCVSINHTHHSGELPRAKRRLPRQDHVSS